MALHPRTVSRHAEDAAFYWARRMEGGHSSLHDLRSLGRFEALLHANLRGLRVAQHESGRFDAQGVLMRPGSGGWDASWHRVMRWKTADEAFVAATLALEHAHTRPEWLAQLHDLACTQFDAAAACTLPPVARGLASAAAWLPWHAVQASVHTWAHSHEPVLRCCAVTALALHRVPGGPALAHWLDDDHALVRSRALQAVGELGRDDLAGALLQVLDAASCDDAAHRCRQAAMASLCLLGHPRASSEVPLAGSYGKAKEPGAAVLALWAQAATAAALRHSIEAALAHRTQWRRALTLIRFSGQAHWADMLIQLMQDQWSAPAVAAYFHEPASNLARQAADVFAHITGARIAHRLWRAAPEREADAADDAASDPRIPVARKQDPDDGLPWPDVEAVQQWWLARRPQLGVDLERRHLAGLPLSAKEGGTARQVLGDAHATQLQRHHAALHLRCARLVPQLFDVRAPLAMQRQRAAAMGVVLGLA